MKTSWKIGSIIGVMAIISMSAVGVAYASTGSITPDCSNSNSLCVFSWVKCNDNGATVAHATATINSTKDTINFILNNDYPGYIPTISFGLLNQSYMPGAISSITINCPQYFTMTLTGIAKGQVIDPNKEITGALNITFLNSAPNSTMGKTYTMSVTILVTQSSQPCQNKTSTCLTFTPNPSVFGQPVTFTAKVTGDGGTPTGSVTFYDGTKTIGTIPSPLVNGTATLNYSGLSVGSHSITASYAGDTKYSGSLSNVVTQVVNAIKTTTTTALLSSVNPSVFGQSITFTASVSPKTATGSVIFYDNNTPLKTVSLSGNSTSISISTLIVSSHNITAVYSGDSNFASSTSNVVVQKVRSKTVCTWPVKSSPCNFGQTCTFKVQIGWQGSSNPTGTVTFFDGSNSIGTGSWFGDTAVLNCSLSAGSHNITAKYSGDDNYDGSTSDAITQTVNKISSATTLKSSASPAKSGSQVTFTATVTPNSATGTVTFKDGNASIGTGNLSGGQATFSTKLSPGTHSITAVYGGDTNFSGNTSSTISQKIN